VLTLDFAARALKSAITVLLAFLAPVQGIVVGTIALVTLDAITGVWAALRARQRITSFRLSRSVAKLVVYFTLILLGRVLSGLFNTPYPVAEMISAFISLTESLSILENLNKLSKSPIIDRLIDMLKRKADDNDKTH
jgi:phage-related holin